MNRHERRRQAATNRGQDITTHPEYRRVIEEIVHAFHWWRRTAPESPRFAMPPSEFMVIASLEVIADRIARNESAQWFLKALIDRAEQTGDPKKMPTLFMLRIALEYVGAEIEIVSLSELGLSVQGIGQGQN